MGKIIGNLDLELAKHYSRLLEEGVLHEETGSNYSVAFAGEDAIKFPIGFNTERFDEYAQELVHQFNMGSRLSEIGFQGCKMHGVYLEKGEVPFLVMERIFGLIKPHELKTNERKIAKKQYNEQIELAKRNGFVPGDVYFAGENPDPRKLSHEANWGFQRKTGLVRFFDFADWRIN
ncbi:MAG: hypothetical protein Q8N63_00695 [Nanoarchaeota archaeon]|nr:hypothetical protein [Nanoarchaeota archaeon]